MGMGMWQLSKNAHWHLVVVVFLLLSSVLIVSNYCIDTRETVVFLVLVRRHFPLKIHDGVL